MQITPQLKEACRKLVFSTAARAAKIDKADIVSEFSNGRTCSIGELTEIEGRALHTYLYGIVQEHARTKAGVADKKRKKVIAYLRQAGFETVKDGQVVADMPRINNWVELNFKANLNALSTTQLSKVIEGAKNVYQSQIKKQG